MACPRCALRLPKRPRTISPLSTPLRSFHTTPGRQRLGAFTYAQEWQAGHYSFNKAHAPHYPVAAARTDELLQNWATQFKSDRRSAAASSDASAPSDGKTTYAQQMQRNAIIAQRRKTDRFLISHATAKDFGSKVEVTAFVYDGITAVHDEKEKKQQAFLARTGTGAGGAAGKPAGQTRRPRAAGGAGGAGGPGGAGARMRTTNFGGQRRLGAVGGAGARAGGAGGSTGFRRVQLGGTGGAGRGQGSRFSRPAGPPKAAPAR